MAITINDQLKKTMQNSRERVQNRDPMQRAALKNSMAQNAAKPVGQIGQKSSSAYKRLSAAPVRQIAPRVNTGWQYKADGTRKTFSELSTPEVLTWIGTLPENERGGAARDFETNYLKNPASTRYDPYYTDYSNNDNARSLFGVNTFDQKWIDDNRGYANYLTFSGENYTTPKKPGKNASEEEKRAYEWWQIANTYEATTQAAEKEYDQLRSEIQEMVKISRKAGDQLTADEILQGIDWSDYKTLENLREASAAGNGRYLNRPVQVGDASLKSMVNAAIRGEDVTKARDFVYGESEYLRTGAAKSKYMLPIEEAASAAAPKKASPYADVTNPEYDPYYGEGSNNQTARELFGVDAFDQEWIDKNRGLMAYVKFKDEDATEPIKPGEDASEQEKAAYEYWKIANTYEETTRKAENELSTLQSWMEKQAEKLGEEATAEAILDRIDWEDKDWQDEYPTLYNMREVAATGNARMVNRPVGAGDASLRRMAESILGADGNENVDVNDAADVNKTQDANGKPQAPAGALTENSDEKPLTERRDARTEKEIQQLQTRIGGLRRAIEIGRISEEKKAEYEAEIADIERQLYGDRVQQPAFEIIQSEKTAETADPELQAPTKTQPTAPKTASELASESRAEYGTTGAANQLKVTINYLNSLEAQGQLTDELRAKRDEWQAEYDRLMDDVAERKEIEERVRADFLTADFSEMNPVKWISDGLFQDALRDAEFVPTEDYEDYLRYRRNAVNFSEERQAELAEYNRLGAAQERLSLIAEGVATGMDKAATAVTGGLEYVLYTMARWDPATKGMTKDEVYASDMMLAALKGWNAQYDKQYISDEKKAELADKYPVAAVVSTGVSEMLKMMGQAGGALPVNINMAGDVARYGLAGLQRGGAGMNALNKLGKYAAQTMPFALDVYGSTYETAISEGATEDQAAAAAALNGLFTGTLSSAVTSRLGKLGGNIARLFGSRAGQKAAQQGAIAAAKNGTLNAIMALGRQLLESAVEEGTEEALEVPIENFIAKAVYDRGRAWSGEGGVFDAKAMMESGIGGAVAGTMFTVTAGASGMMGRPAKTAADQIIEEALNGEEISQSDIEELEKIEAREAAIQDKAEDIMAADTGAIDAAEAKTAAAEKKAQEAEAKLQEAETQVQEVNEASKPIWDELKNGTKSYGDPEVAKAIAESRKQMDEALKASRAQANVVETARQKYAQMVQERDETAQKAQENARAQATAEVEAELQQEKEAEAQALAEAEKAEAERKAEPGVKWQAKKPESALNDTQRRQIQILGELGKEYGIEIDIVDTLGPGKNGMYAGGRRISVALDATESAYVQVGVHEMVHYVRGMDESAYAALEQVVADHLEKNDEFDLNTLIQQRIQKYRGTQELTEDAAREEIIAEIVPQVLTNEESARVLVENNRTLAQKIRDFFIEFSNKLRSIAERYAVANDRGEVFAFDENTEALVEIANVLDDALNRVKTAEKKAELREKNSAKSEESRYSYEALISKPDMPLTVIPSKSDAKDAKTIIERGLENARAHGGVNENGNAVVSVEDLGGDVLVGKKGLQHGLDRRRDNQAPIIENVGSILKNAIVINEADPENPAAKDSYILLGAAKNSNNDTFIVRFVVNRFDGLLSEFDVLYSAYGKKNGIGTQRDEISGDYAPASTDSTIRVSDLLESVKGHFDDVISKDVAERLNIERSDSKFTDALRYSLKSDEEIAQTVEDVKAEEKAEALDDAARIANRTAREYKSTIERSEISDGIDQMIEAYQDHDDAKAAGIADELARKILDKSRTTDTSHREGYEEIRKRLREQGFSLTDTQKQEVASRLGSYNDWRKSVMGSVKVKNDAGSLDSIWGELSGMNPEYFPADANEAQMPEYIEKFVQAMRPKYANPYDMNMTEAAADLSTRLQADVLETLNKNETAARLRADSDSLREQGRVRGEEKRAKARQQRADRFGEIAQRIKAGRDAGDAKTVQDALTEYRRLMGGKSHAADAIESGLEAKRLRAEARRIEGIIDNLNDMINGEDTDFDRKNLNEQLESYEELHEQLMRQANALHRQEVLDRAAIPDDEMDPDMEAQLALEMQKTMDEDMEETISERVVEMRGRVRSLWMRMKARMKDFNMTSTIPKDELIATFKDLEGEIVRHSELAKVWARRETNYTAQKLGEENQLSWLKNDLKRAEQRGDQAAANAAREQILETQDRIDVLNSQIKNAKAQAQYSRRIGAESLEKALNEGRLPEPIMERVIAMCRDAGRSGRFNENIVVKATEAIRLNSTTAARVYDDLFGDAAPLMRAIYYDPVMDNETDRQRWIKQWRERIGALELTKEQSALVQEIGEGRLGPKDERYRMADQKVHDAVKVFRAFYDEAHAMATKALVRNGYERPGKITDYFPHIETQKTFWDKLGIPMENTSLPTSINGLTETFTPGKQYSSHLEHRLGEKTDYDALYGFEQYIGGMSNVIFHTDDIQRHRQLEREIRAAASKGKFSGGQRSEHLSEFVKWIHEYTNQLAGKKAGLDRPFEGTGGRAIYAALMRFKAIKGASAVCGNLASAVTNMVPVTQVLAEAPLATVKGVIQMCMGVSNGRGNIPESQYKIRKLGSDSVVETLYTRFTHFAGKPFALVDLLATNIVVNAYYQDNLQKGMDSETAMRSADSKAARLMADRSKGAMPNIYGSQVAGFLTQFQLEIANQSQHFRKDIWRTGSAKKAMVTLLATALTGYIWNEFNEWLTGRRPAADPIQMGLDIYHTWKDGGSPMEIGQAAYNSLSEMMPYSNLGGRVAAFEGVGTFVEALTTEGNDGGDVLYAMAQLGYGIVPGGGQLKKTWQGALATNLAHINDFMSGTFEALHLPFAVAPYGGKYNTSGTQLRYAVPDWSEDWTSALQAVIFGVSSTKGAQAYYGDSPGIVEYGKAAKAAINGEGWTAPERIEAPGLTTAQTRNYEQARERGATSTEAYLNEADKAAAAKLENEASKAENAQEEAKAIARSGDEAPEVDTSQVESQREEAAKLRANAMPGDELTDFWWERKDTPQVQAGIEIWRKTGKAWALPFAYTADKSYSIDKRTERLGSALLPEAEAMYEEGYMEIMDGIDPEKLDEEGYAELQELLEDLKAEVNAEMKKRIRERNKELE